MTSYDVFAGNARYESLAHEKDTYFKLLRWHSVGCMESKPETKAKEELKQVLGKTQKGFGRFDLMKGLGLDRVAGEAIAKLPEGAVLLQFGFTLAKKYVSRDDTAFFPTDNPLRRDHVFKVPMIAPATWKGSLRAAAVERLILGTDAAQQRVDRVTLLNLFGDEKADEEDGVEAGEDERQHKLRNFTNRHASGTKDDYDAALDKLNNGGHKRGRLIFFPSWFEKTVLDVLNPRNPAKRVGTVPITLEAVPSKSQSSFTLLYFPFDLLGRAEKEIAKAQQNDWRITGEALAHMLLTSGFGAKKTSGCGRIIPTIKEFRFECRSSGGFSAPEITKAQDLSGLGKAFAEAAK